MIPRAFRHPAVAAVFLLLVAVLQLFVFVRGEVDGRWFLYGRDTVAHDAIAHLWIQRELSINPAVIPLWAAGIQGGIPTVGSFLWTPLSRAVWPLHFLGYPEAQKLGWLLALWIAGLGGFVLGRALKLRFESALFLAIAWMLSGHIVTLIHAGHFQKVVALSWLGWAAAGSAMLADPHSGRRRARGAATAAVAIGMMFLGGHPQIAYAGMVLIATQAIWLMALRAASRRRWFAIGASTIGAVALGLALGGAQLLPGMEMSRLSNRADGVSFEEAVEASYPPGELAELAIPRYRGSSVFGDVYTGDWGERIVSDYAGKVVLVLVLLALLGFLGRGHIVFYWSGLAVVSLLVGVGYHTPVYRFLYDHAPGFKSFRSPGTFMAGAALAFPVLGACGMEALLRGVRQVRWRAVPPLVYTVILLLAAVDLMVANRHFLFREPWARMELGYLAPTELDLWLIDRGLLEETHDIMQELRLRPILFGGRAINGYHPIVYRIKADQDRALGFNTMARYRAWGVTRLLIPADAKELPSGVRIERVFAGEGRAVAELTESMPFLEVPPGGKATLRRITANESKLDVDAPAGVVSVAEILGPGFEIVKDRMVLRTTAKPLLGLDIDHPGGSAAYRWIYRPFSWRLGLYFTALGAGIVAALGTFGARRRRGGLLKKG